MKRTILLCWFAAQKQTSTFKWQKFVLSYIAFTGEFNGLSHNF